jgi:hypothetical protein
MLVPRHAVVLQVDGVMSNQRMLSNFAQYIDPPLPIIHSIVGMPLGARCKRIERMLDGWRVWTATSDYVYGTWLELYDDGTVRQVTARPDEGDEEFIVRPCDDEIRRKLWTR